MIPQTLQIHPGLAPEELSDYHLIGEELTILRIYSVIFSKNAPFIPIPQYFTIKQGDNRRFFCNKLQWVEKRYLAVKQELKNRSFPVNETPLDFSDSVFYLPWEPDALTLKRSRSLMLEIILKGNVLLTFFGEEIDTTYYINCIILKIKNPNVCYKLEKQVTLFQSKL